MKELLKSVHICQSYSKNKSGPVFLTQYKACTMNELLAAAYVKCIKIFFGYSIYQCNCNMLVELGLPSFNAVLHNAAASFSRRLGCSTNRLVIHVCNCSFYSVVPA